MSLEAFLSIVGKARMINGCKFFIVKTTVSYQETTADLRRVYVASKHTSRKKTSTKLIYLDFLFYQTLVSVAMCVAINYPSTRIFVLRSFSDHFHFVVYLALSRTRFFINCAEV